MLRKIFAESKRHPKGRYVDGRRHVPPHGGHFATVDILDQFSEVIRLKQCHPSVCQIGVEFVIKADDFIGYFGGDYTQL